MKNVLVCTITCSNHCNIRYVHLILTIEVPVEEEEEDPFEPTEEHHIPPGLITVSQLMIRQTRNLFDLLVCQLYYTI